MRRSVWSSVLVFVVMIGPVFLVSWRPAAMRLDAARAYAGGSPSTNQKSPAPDETTLKKAAAVLPKVRRINLDVQLALEKTKDKHQQQQILSRGQAEQLAAVSKIGLTATQYEEVLEAVRSDPAMRTKFVSYLNGAPSPQP